MYLNMEHLFLLIYFKVRAAVHRPPYFCVRKAPKVWHRLMGFNVEVILQCYNFNLHLSSIRIEHSTRTNT